LVDCITNTCGGRREPDRTNKWKAQAIPRLSRVAVLWDVGTGAVPGGAASMLEVAARSLQLQLQHLQVRAASDVEGAFKAAKKDAAGALLLMETP